MKIAVLCEQAEGERRVALVPESVKKLTAKGLHQVVVQASAGAKAFHPDAEYTAAGATVVQTAAEALKEAQVLLGINAPAPATLSALPKGATVIALLRPSDALKQALTAQGLTAVALEKVPRTTRAQAADVLSSQATVAGYAAVLLGASALPRLMPMLTTAAGTLTPAKVLVCGAGVAGLQAIATARRLGAQVTGFDVRAAAREQVASLGAKFIELPQPTAAAEGQGGYAKEAGEALTALIQSTLGEVVPQFDLFVTTAAIPGKKAPILFTKAAMERLKPGAVVVDLAAETGGNTELTRAGETVAAGQGKIIGPLQLASTHAQHASSMFSRNLVTLLGFMSAEGGALQVDEKDDVVGPMLVSLNGALKGA
ncbi:MAG: NAD(P) transhydrogenase subunit alpha [Myxococcaceae bacterium]|nr:NAD(P) transhydrogenase subunit alpha [Myxococcaceae bacterium]